MANENAKPHATLATAGNVCEDKKDEVPMELNALHTDGAMRFTFRGAVGARAGWLDAAAESLTRADGRFASPRQEAP